MGAMVTIFDPQGNRGEIPEANLAAAVKAGAMPGISVKAPDGTPGHVPANRIADVVKAGGKILPFEQQDVKHPGFWSTLVDDVKGMASGAYHAVADNDPMTDPNLSEAEKMKIADQQSAAAQATNAAREKAHGKAYSLGASANEMLGVNVAGEEKSAEEGDPGGVLGHAAAVPAVMATTAAVTPFATRLAESLSDTPAAIAEKLRNATPKQAAQAVGATTGAVAGHGPLSIPGAYYGAKGAGSMVESIIGKERANAPIFPGARPVYPGAPFPERPGVFPGAPLPANPLPEQLNPALVSPARTLPGMNSPEVIRPPAEPIPARPGLQLAGDVQIPARFQPPVAEAAPEAPIPQPMSVTPSGEGIPRTLSGESALRDVLSRQDNANLMKIARSRGINVTKEAQLKASVADKSLINKIVDDFSDDELHNLRSTYIENRRMGRHEFGDIGAEAWKTMAMQTYFPDVKISLAQTLRTQKAITTAGAQKFAPVTDLAQTLKSNAKATAAAKPAAGAVTPGPMDDLTQILQESVRAEEAKAARQ